MQPCMKTPVSLLREALQAKLPTLYRVQGYRAHCAADIVLYTAYCTVHNSGL